MFDPRIMRITEYDSFDAMLDAEDPATIGFEQGLTRDDMLARVRDIYPAER